MINIRGKTTFGPDMINDSSLVLYLDSKNTKSYPGTGTVWYDLSGNVNHGHFSGDILFQNNLVNFNTGDESLSIFDSTSIFNSVSTSSFTVETIVRSTDVVYPRSRHPFYVNDTVTGLSTKGWSVGHQSSSTTIEVRCCDTTSLESGTINHIVNESTFYHRIFIVDRTSGCLTKYYVNGEYIAQFNATSVTGSIYGGNGLVFGNVWGWRYIGDPASLKLYNRTLSDSEILQNFNAIKSRFGL